MTKTGCDQEILDEINRLREDISSCRAMLNGYYGASCKFTGRSGLTYSARCELVARIKNDRLAIEEYQKLL